MPVRHHLVRPEVLVHDMVADVRHPRCEVVAEIATSCLPRIEVMVVAEPWKLMASATTRGPTSSTRRTILLTASQLRRERAPEVALNVVHPAMLVVAREHHLTPCQIPEFAG